MQSYQKKIAIEVQGIDKVKTLIELLSIHMDDLPYELQRSLRELSDCDSCEIGVDWLIDNKINPLDV